ncbi:MAG: phage shock protein PspA [Pseudomonadota bacterium]|uniref:phage shock protein PspA n=1 Tax=Sinimarinibacterium flocculans TaxID=985250 RepID=UPI002EB3B409|nr:phage shock protein PspA [Pseudomonadota bacterium]
MGIFSRLSDVINSNIHAMLDKAEDPEKMVRLIIQEMEDTLVEVRSTAVRSLARKKELQRQIAQLDADVHDWERKAELAMTKDREDLARGALSARQRLIDHKQAVDKELAHVHDEIVKLDDDTAKLKAKLADARQRQKSIILRQQSVSSRLKVKTQINDSKMTDAMLRMEQYEGKIDRMEAELEAYDLGTRTVSDQFAQLESDDKVEAELAKLRSKFGKGEAPAAGPETDDSANR